MIATQDALAYTPKLDKHTEFPSASHSLSLAMSNVDVAKQVAERKFIYCFLCGRKLTLLQSGKIRMHTKRPGGEVCKASRLQFSFGD